GPRALPAGGGGVARAGRGPRRRCGGVHPVDARRRARVAAGCRRTACLHALVRRTRAVDAATSDTIHANLPDEHVGFGGFRAREITRDEVERQRVRPPEAVNQWWLSLTPEQ